MNFCRYGHWPGGDGEVIVVELLVLVCACGCELVDKPHAFARNVVPPAHVEHSPVCAVERDVVLRGVPQCVGGCRFDRERYITEDVWLSHQQL